MKMLEMRTKMSRFEMEALERIEELKEMNVRQAKPNLEGIIGEITKDRHLALKRQEEEDEAFVKYSIIKDFFNLCIANFRL